MKIEPIEFKPRSFAEYGINITKRSNSDGEVRMLCPVCSHTRKKSNDPCLYVNVKKSKWFCFNCDFKGSLDNMTEEEYKSHKAWERKNNINASEAKAKPTFTEPKEYDKPNHVSESLSPEWLKWLESRAIDGHTANANRLSDTNYYMPQTKRKESVLCFNYYKDDEVVNIKYRDVKKNFIQTKNTERTVYGYDDIEPDKPLIWVEGEMDKLSFYVAGFSNCVSVPDGAPSANAKNVNKKFDFLAGIEDKIADVSTHIIAVDNDAPGVKLREELARRLGLKNCKIIYWCKGIKDANDALMHKGIKYLQSEVDNAKFYPIQGVLGFSDNEEKLMELYYNGLESGRKVGYEGFDYLYSVNDGGFTVVTGAPGSGKSEFLDNIALNLAKNYGFKTLLFSPENQPVEMHKAKLLEKWIGQNFYSSSHGARMTPETLAEEMRRMNDYITFTLPEDPTIDNIIEIAELEVYRKGINGMIIDPWNEIAHKRDGNISETEYIGEALRVLRKFARQNKIHLWIVAHPTKLRKNQDGSYEVATLYDINGSANWNNKADNGISVYRGNGYTDVHVQKVRMKHLGMLGVQRFLYNNNSGTYTPVFASEEF